jgi:hypothetical protein
MAAETFERMIPALVAFDDCCEVKDFTLREHIPAALRVTPLGQRGRPPKNWAP